MKTDSPEDSKPNLTVPLEVLPNEALVGAVELDSANSEVSSEKQDSIPDISSAHESVNTSHKMGESSDIQDLKTTLIDSAELATRGASLAAKAGVEMHQAALKLMENSLIQQKTNKIILGIFAGTMLVAIVLFVFIAVRMQSKVSQLDAMVLAVGKRVVSMDASIEQVSSASDLLKDVAQKQDAINSAQVKLESRIDEAIKTAQAAPDLKAKQLEDKNKDLLKLIQSLDGKIQAQASSAKSISGQIQKVQSSLSDASNLKRELDTLNRQLKEKKSQEALVAVPTPISAPVAVKPRERLVQFPRTSQPGSSSEKP